MIKLNGLYGTGYSAGPSPLDGFLEMAGLGMLTQQNHGLTQQGRIAAGIEKPSMISKVTGYAKKHPFRLAAVGILGLWAAKKIKLPILGKRK